MVPLNREVDLDLVIFAFFWARTVYKGPVWPDETMDKQYKPVLIPSLNKKRGADN